MTQTLQVRLDRALTLCLVLLLGIGLTTDTWAQYTAGNVVVVRVGDGTTALSNAANPVNLVEYNPAGSTVNTVALPTTVSGSNRRLTVSGSASSEGILKLSADNRYLTIAGYDADVATASVASSGTPDRVVAVIDNNRTVNTTTVLPQSAAYNTNNIRSAVTSNGTTIWTGGTASTNSRGGVRATTTGATDGGTQVSNSVTNIRVVGIFNNQLYASSSSGAFLGISTIGTGLPTTSGSTSTTIINAGAGSSSYDFAFNPTGTICYVADGRTSTGGGVQKWTYNGSAWSLDYTLAVGGTAGAYGLAVDFSGTDPVIYATTAESSATAVNRIVKITDTGSGSSASTFATAPASTVFRGIAFAPVAPDLTIALSAPASATLNQPFNYSLVISNQGTATASAITAQFALPSSASATYNSTTVASGFTASEAGGIISFSSGTLTAGNSTTLTVSVTPIVTANITSGTAVVDPSNTIAESNESNNSASAVTTAIGSGNLPPIASSIPNQVATVGSAFSYTVPAFTDPESETLTYVITGLSNGLSVDNTTRVISGTPTATGIQTVTVVATDPASNTVNATFSLSVNAASAGVIRITEFAYNGAGPANEFIELTNVGTAPVDMTGWSFDDSSNNPGSFSINGFGVVQPGESVIIAEASEAVFRKAWYLPATVKVIGSNNQNLGNGDELNIYDASNGRVDRLTYPSSSTGGATVFTNGVSAWTTPTNLGTNTIANWVLSAVNDAQNSYASVDGNIGNPGGYNIPLNRVLVRESGNTTTVAEGSTSDTYTVALNSQPTADVTVTITPGSQLTTNVTTLIFTPVNYSVTQTVSVSAVDDNVVEGTHSATLTHAATSTDAAYNGIAINPVSVTITDNDVAAGASPTIVVAGTTTAYLNASVVSGVISDPTDPASTLGIDFTIADSDTPVASLTVTAGSNNASVVPNANLNLTGSNASRNLKITPTGVGYATITVSVSDGTNVSSYSISYAASAASTSTSRFHTGVSDASTAQAIDADYMLVADDENQVLRLYNRANSGLPITGFDYTSSLGLTDISGGVPREVDIESSVRIGNRIYWLGSHSNSSGGSNRPNRSRLFATDLSGSGASATLSYVGRYDGLKTDLINWDVNNSHGLGANYFGFQASAASGVAPEADGGVGFNIEGLTVAPDGTTGYIAFRAPISPASNRTKALIVPVTNFTSLVSANPSAGPASFGTPILLDLGGRGIREIKTNGNGQYLIVAGPSGGAGSNPNAFKLFTWTGNPADLPVMRTADLSGLSGTTGGSSIESIVDLPAPLIETSSIQFLMDNGDQVYYNDGTIAKELAQSNFRKFRSDFATLGAAQYPDLTPTVVLPQANFGSSGPDNVRNFVVNLFESGGLPTSSGSIIITVTAPTGYSVAFDNTLTSIDVTDGTSNPVAVDNTKWTVMNNIANQQLSIQINAGQLVAANGQLVLGFSITRTTANSGSTSSITVNVSDDASKTYDGNPTNNVYSRIISGL